MIEIGIEQVPFAVQTVEYGAEMEDAAIHGMPGLWRQNAGGLPETENLLDGQTVLDLDQDELAALHHIAVDQGMLAGQFPLSIAASLAKIPREALPTEAEIAATAVQNAAAHISSLGTDLDSIGGPEFTFRRIRNRSAGMVASILSARTLESATSIAPRHPRALSKILMFATDVHVGFGRMSLGVETPVERDDFTRSLEGIALAKLDKLPETQFNRYTLFVSLLEEATNQAILKFDQNLRLFDFDTTVAEVFEPTAEAAIAFLATLEDADVDELSETDGQNTTNALFKTAAVALSNEVHDALIFRFATMGHVLDGVANRGRNHYMAVVDNIEQTRNSNPNMAITSRSHPSKQLVFEHYLPEMRKIGVIMGGLYVDLSRVHHAAAAMLDSIYESSEDDTAVFPSPYDFYLQLAQDVQISAMKNERADIGALPGYEKTLLISQLNRHFMHNIAEQDEDNSNCRGADPNLFFTERGASNKPAREICAGCDPERRTNCLEDNLWQLSGIWAGTLHHERRAIRRERGLLGTEVEVSVATAATAAEEKPSRNGTKKSGDDYYDYNDADPDAEPLEVLVADFDEFDEAV